MIDGLNVIERRSPNHGERRLPIDMILIHYTDMESAEAALGRLGDPVAEVSAHYLIDEDGTTYALVDEALRAWHAGAGFWAGETDINSRSIGIELQNPGHGLGYRDFPPTQTAVLERILRYLITKYSIPQKHILGHSDVAPGRKRDPGERFPWQALATAGLGRWPKPRKPDGGPVIAPGKTHALVAATQEALGVYGYGPIRVTGTLDAATEAVVTAFQRHFVPECFAPGTEPPGHLGPLTRARLAGLVDEGAAKA
ncbi:MAG: N-acetylmuramoyl-L-alanine amidase [Alphaproteobacteria bacterium]